MRSVRGITLAVLVVSFALGAAGASTGPDVAPARITHTAATGGDWFDASVWDVGEVPGDGAWVLIPAGTTVRYDAVGAARLDVVKVDGRLEFDPGRSSRMLVDTLVVGTEGELIAGRLDQPVASDTLIEIVIADNGDIDTSWDPKLLSRGLIARGRVSMHGQPKTPHLKVAEDPMAGDTVLTLAYPPENWRVGDTIVVTGTRYSGWRWDNDIRDVRYFGTEDEVRTITGVDGAEVAIDIPLHHDHDSPRADLGASVANFTRNVSIASESGAASAVHHRGHVMFQHNDDVDVRFVELRHLGRTDKSVESFALDQLDMVAPDSNVRGRYAFHFHRAGTDNRAEPGIAIGNAVFDSPGWGYVHHDSNAMFHDNASFQTFGAGFVAETGNETGAWTGNIAIKAQGNRAFNPKNGNDPTTFDMGRTGDGFWFQGRLVRAVDNIAASVNTGYVYLHRGSGMLDFPSDRFMLPEALGVAGMSSPDDAPIFNFDGNEAFASTVGVFVVKANPNQQHDIRTHMSNFTAWSVEAGAAMQYTSHYLLTDFDLIAKDPERFNDPAFGIEFGTNTSDMSVVRPRIEGFETGIVLGKHFTSPVSPEVNQYVIVEPLFIDVAEHYVSFDAAVDTVIDQSDLVDGRFEIALDDSDPLEYLDPCTAAGCGVDYTGTKTDSIGPIPIPAGTDGIGTGNQEMIAIVANDGYYRAGDGTLWAVVEEYFSDRATGEIHKFGLRTWLGPDVVGILGNRFHAWAEAFERGPIDLASRPPAAANDFAVVPADGSATIPVLGNDTDPDGDALVVDGIVAPHHGEVFDNGDGTVSYVADIGFTGIDSFGYWASDGNGHFTPARVAVSVENGYLFGDGFE